VQHHSGFSTGKWVVFVGAGDITIITTIILAMAQLKTSTLIVMLRVNNLANMGTGSPLFFPHG